MNRQAQIIIVTLIVIIVGLGVTVGVMVASDDGRNDSMNGHMAWKERSR